ncbi:MAG TPA: non-canonical purine NTP pyrophosphatase, RdgB/HAM1 family [Clostridiales bacterium]|nr:non-canonical purine NTP pyrophosphatase, RdgB/HAM1 family [Clostridiales bacterium]
MEQKIMVLASSNKHKIKEIGDMFSCSEATKDIKILSLKDIGFEGDIEETGETFLENSLIKAKAISQFLKSKNLSYMVLADDSGLAVDVLNGAPGVYSARFAGEHGNNQENRNKLLRELKDETNRQAKFVCTLVLMWPNGEYISCVGETFGEITHEEIGNTEFCYDCLFYSHDLKKTFGESTEEEKNSVSHRGRAVKKLISEIEKM